MHTPVAEQRDSYVYDLPYSKGVSYKVVQGYGGLFSHTYTAAIDFEMPEGTEVCAARDGEVFAYKDNSSEGGPFSKYKDKANYLIIKHSDGSFGCYWHLQKNGVLVKKGKVSKGQVIALSGSTGYVLAPHLHFSVKIKLNYDEDAYVRTVFATDKGIVELKEGSWYEKM
ncbi:MAG: M23 family metallopeptidase [Bacteroidetes bacterium]|nr:M23 family metallopeptidase [Bacteroidota bacterium]